jgi:hypothetical protein
MNKPWIAEHTAEINAAADAISALNIGDGVSVSVWTDIDAYTIVKKTATTITLRGDHQKLANREELRFVSGGFMAHCENQEVQRYEYSPNLDGFEIKITLRRWKDEQGNQRRKWKRANTGTFDNGGNAYAGRRAFRDYNF